MPRPADLLDWWAGADGDAYMRRNPVTRADVTRRARSLARVLSHIHPEPVSILEIGCGPGANLIALRGITAAKLYAVEPNEAARALAVEHADGMYDGHAGAIQAADGTFPLVFTAGVLIHVPPEVLRDAMIEIARVSSRHVLAVEYFAPSEEAVAYYGADRIWRRDYGKLYLDLGLRAVAHGFFWKTGEDGYDNTVWWLLEKR